MSQVDEMFAKARQLRDKQALAVFLEDMKLVKGVIGKWSSRFDRLLGAGGNKENGVAGSRGPPFRNTRDEILAESHGGAPPAQPLSPADLNRRRPRGWDTAAGSPLTAAGSPFRTPAARRAPIADLMRTPPSAAATPSPRGAAHPRPATAAPATPRWQPAGSPAASMRTPPPASSGAPSSVRRPRSALAPYRQVERSRCAAGCH